MAKRENKIGNFFPINRKFFKHPFWTEKRTFSKSEAWLDLMQSARFEESEATELIGGKLVRWSRGQVPASIRFLADNWGWSRGKVEDFLRMLEKMDMITRHQEAGQTVITLSNYTFYNAFGQQNGQTSGQVKRPQQKNTEESPDSGKDSEADTKQTPGRHGADETNKDNKEKNENTVPGGAGPLSQAQRFKNFQDWIQANAPQVAKLSSPFTEKQYATIRDEYDMKDVMDVLKAMENKKSLLKDYKSAYLTCDNWLKRRAENGQNRKKNGSESDERQSKAEIIGQRIAQGLPGTSE